MNTHHNLIIQRLSAPKTLHLLKGKKIPFFSHVSKHCEFFAVHFLAKPEHKKGRAVHTPCKSRYGWGLAWFAPTPSHAACGCCQCPLPKVSPWSLTVLVQRAGLETGTRQMLQFWFFYNLLVKLHSHMMPPDLLSKGLLSEKLPSNPALAAVPRTAHAVFEVRKANGLPRLSQP